MPKPTIVDFSTVFNANIIQPLCDLAWDVFGSDAEDRPVNTVDEAREKLKAVAQAGDTMTGPLTLPASDPTLDNHAARKAYVDAQIDKLYPIGSIYFCTAATDPNSALPGTWTLLTEGQFLVSAGGAGDYALGATGGEEEVTLTEAQMPQHSHSTKMRNDASGATTGIARVIPWDDPVFVSTWNRDDASNPMEPVGGDQPHENRPPYLAVNMWQRTA